MFSTKIKNSIKKWAAARTQIWTGDKEASTREKIQAAFAGLHGHCLERQFIYLTDSSSLASGVEKTKKRKELKKRRNLRLLQKLTQKLK